MFRNPMIVLSRILLATATVVLLALPAGAVEPQSPPANDTVTLPAAPAATPATPTTNITAPSKRGFSIDPNG
jgi:hypothetical protein